MDLFLRYFECLTAEKCHILENIMNQRLNTAKFKVFINDPWRFYLLELDIPSPLKPQMAFYLLTEIKSPKSGLFLF